MIVITLSAERYSDTNERETDPLGRDRVGYAPTMSDVALYDANRGMWVIGDDRARTERYALFVYDGITRQAVEITSIDKLPWRRPHDAPPKSAITGSILEPGHRIYDAYVGKPSPLPRLKNPVRYYDAPEEHDLIVQPLCGCGCGDQTVERGQVFVPGHEQTALHQRVKEIGTIEEFIAWFDALRRPWTAQDTPDDAPHPPHRVDLAR